MNVALRLASLGGAVRLATRVGCDEAGDKLLAYLRQAGLDTRDVQRDPRHPTGRVLVDLTNPHEARYTIEQPAAWDFIATDEALQEPGGGLAIVFGSLAARSVTSRQTLLGLLDAAPLRVFDVNLRPPHVERSVIESLLQRANWAKLNGDELHVIAGWHGWTGHFDALLHRLAAHYRLDCVCVTLGADGAVMLRDGQLHRQAGFDVPVVDTIGCGDSFLASWLLDLDAGQRPRARPAPRLRARCAGGHCGRCQPGRRRCARRRAGRPVDLADRAPAGAPTPVSAVPGPRRCARACGLSSRASVSARTAAAAPSRRRKSRRSSRR